MYEELCREYILLLSELSSLLFDCYSVVRGHGIVNL